MPNAYYYHSLKKRKDSLETWTVLIEISILSWNLPNGLKHRGSLFNKMAFSEGNQPLESDYHALVDEINPGMLQYTKKWNWKWNV